MKLLNRTYWKPCRNGEFTEVETMRRLVGREPAIRAAVAAIPGVQHVSVYRYSVVVRRLLGGNARRWREIVPQVQAALQAAFP